MIISLRFFGESIFLLPIFFSKNPLINCIIYCSLENTRELAHNLGSYNKRQLFYCMQLRTYIWYRLPFWRNQLIFDRVAINKNIKQKLRPSINLARYLSHNILQVAIFFQSVPFPSKVRRVSLRFCINLDFYLDLSTETV